jgi:hypothetical protein
VLDNDPAAGGGLDHCTLCIHACVHVCMRRLHGCRVSHVAWAMQLTLVLTHDGIEVYRNYETSMNTHCIAHAYEHALLRAEMTRGCKHVYMYIWPLYLTSARLFCTDSKMSWLDIMYLYPFCVADSLS